jgi:PAS domain S-box-containing protein
VVAGSVGLGVLSTLAVCAAWWRHTEAPVGSGTPPWWLVLVLLVGTIAAETVSVPLRHGEEQEALTLFEAAVVIDVLLLSPSLAAVITSLALALASAIDRRVLIKSVFNLGSHATSTAALISSVTLFGGHGIGFSSRLLFAAGLGVVLFAGINLIMLARVLSVAADVPIQSTLQETWKLSSIMAAGGIALGSVAVVIGRSAPVLLPFTLLPAVALRYAFRTAAEEAEERARSSRLLALSQVLAGRFETGDLLSNFLGLMRETFPVREVFVVFEGDEQSSGDVVVADEQGVRRRDLTATDAVLLSCAGETAAFLDRGLPDGWGRTLLAPLEAEGLRLGVLVLAGQPTWRPALVGRDLAVLTPLVSALAVALRGAEHHERLLAETSKLQAVVDQSTDGIMVLDGDGRVVLWSPAMAALAGVDAETALGRQLPEVVNTVEAEGVPYDPWAATCEQLRPSNPRITSENGILRPDGEQRWIRASHAAVFDGDDLRRDVVLVHDVTKERLVDRMKADFIATVSHELRTPMTPIKGYTDLLRRKGENLSPDKRKEILDIVADRVAHLGRLVEDLLLASRISSPASAVRMATGDLGALATKVVSDFSTDAARLSLTVPEEPLEVPCDPVRVVQVVSNLVSNALKYSGDDAPVAVTVRSDRTTAIVEVSDRGRGIPADQIERVFEKFHRVEDPMRMTTGGTGLGLFISRQLAEAMGGSLTATSVLGEGSTFTFTIDRTARVSPAEAAESPAQRAPAWRTGQSLPQPRRADAAGRVSTTENAAG